jgi:hypothetical protein
MEKFLAEERKRLGIRGVVDEYGWPGGDNGRKPQGK